MSLSKSMFLVVFTLVACNKPTESMDAGAPKPSASVSGTASATPSASASAAVSAAPSASAMADVDGGPNGVLVLRWSATKPKADSPKLDISLKAGDTVVPVGDLDATSDDAKKSGTPAACSLKKTSSTTSTFTCGGVPAYNFLTAELKGNELVISRTKGVDGKNNSEKTTEVKRVPTTKGALRTLAYEP